MLRKFLKACNVPKMSTSFKNMKIALTIFCLLICKVICAQNLSTSFVTTDIDNFWTAYDRIVATKDSSQKYEYLDRYFISKGTPGLKAMMKARSYTNKSYIDAIEQYPLFWKSIRSSMFKAKAYSNEIAANVKKLKTLYPALRPAKIYFTVGAFRSGGTTMDSLVLIGSEIAMADEHTVTQEFATSLPGLFTYFKTNPVQTLVFTNVHEYVHTQQKTSVANNLLGQCLLEGVAEFLAEKATGKASTLPALKYGRLNAQRIKEVFATEMFNGSEGFWLYSNMTNEFGNRDLGYYVGYAMCESYYQKAKNKAQAIKEMIELDYNNTIDLNNFVNQTGYFEKPMAELVNAYEDNRPTVTKITPLEDGQVLDPSVGEITIHFSTAMNKRNRNFELGPLGKDNLLIIKQPLTFAEDGKSISFKVELKSNQHYQIVVGQGFRNIKGAALKPFLIDFTTR